AQSAPANAFLLSGADARLLAQHIDSVSGVIASYPQGLSLRIIAEAEAEERLQYVASTNDASLARVAMRLEHAALVCSSQSPRSSACSSPCRGAVSAAVSRACRPWPASNAYISCAIARPARLS